MAVVIRAVIIGLVVAIVGTIPRDSPARLFIPRRERVYITARACELELCGTKGLQAAGAGGLLRTSFLLAEELYEATNPGSAADLGIGPTYDELLDVTREYVQT